jgi:hypothetical protein
VAVALAEATTSAAVSAALAEETLKAAGLIAAGKTAAGVVSAPVVALTEGVLQAMFLNKLRTVGVVLACLVLLGTGIGVLAYQRPPAADPAGDQAAAPAPDEKKKEEPAADKARADDEVQALLKERLEVAKDGYEACMQEFQAGRASHEQVWEWSRKVLEAELDRTDKKDERLALLKKYVEGMQDVEKITKARYDAGRLSITDLDAAKLARIEAQLRLAREKAK